MNQQTTEQSWQQLSLRINGMLNRFLREDVLAIEHKSDVTALLPMPIAYINAGEMRSEE